VRALRLRPRSPPPCGWSQGFIAMPRVVGRIPRHRLAPALPRTRSFQTEFEREPIVARQLARSLRVSPEGSLARGRGRESGWRTGGKGESGRRAASGCGACGGDAARALLL
jgi:hypothetical protein